MKNLVAGSGEEGASEVGYGGREERRVPVCEVGVRGRGERRVPVKWGGGDG